MAGASGVSEWLKGQGYETSRPMTEFKNHDRCRFPAVEVKLSMSRPFYEAAILLESLNEIYWEAVLSREYEPRETNVMNTDPSSRDFINKLCQFCDSQVGGATVTACAMLEYQDHIEYRFASNSLNPRQSQETTDFIIEVLGTLQKACPGRLNLTRSNLLKQVVRFCRKKLQAYIAALVKQVTHCLDSHDCSGSVLYELETLQSLSIDANDRAADENSFFQRCESLLNHLDRFLSSDETASFILNKARETHKPRPQNCWAGLRHSSARLVSYIRATKALTIAQLSWPSLRKPIEVRFLPSSKPDDNPLNDASQRPVITAETIIGKMTGDVQLREQYQSGAQQLQKQGLDKLIQERARADSFKPQVHAEVLVAYSLEQQGLLSPMHFFNHDAYIGASKPSCQLCHWYFERRDGGIQTRPTHGNFYPRWKLPDICQCAGDALSLLNRDRTAVLKGITESVRREVLRVIQEKAPKGKVHDSTTDPTFPVPSLGGGESAGLDDEVCDEPPDGCALLLERERRPYGSGHAG